MKPLLRRLFDNPQYSARLPVALRLRGVLALTFFLFALFPVTAQQLTPQGDKLMSQVHREAIMNNFTQGCMASRSDGNRIVIGIPEEIFFAYCSCMARRALDVFSTEELLGFSAISKEERARHPKIMAVNTVHGKLCTEEANQKANKLQELKNREFQAQRELKKKEELRKKEAAE